MDGVSCSGSQSKVRVEGSDLVSDSSDERSLLSKSLLLKFLVLLDLSDGYSSWSESDLSLLAISSLGVARLALHALHLGA